MKIKSILIENKLQFIVIKLIFSKLNRITESGTNAEHIWAVDYPFYITDENEFDSYTKGLRIYEEISFIDYIKKLNKNNPNLINLTK